MKPGRLRTCSRCLAATVLVACLVNCATVRGSRSEPTTSVVIGTMRVTGDIFEDFPCTVLKPVLAQALEYGVDTCNAVPLTFIPANGRSSETVFDLWVVTGNESIVAGAASDVVDFYERVALGEIGDAACGRFELKRYQVLGRSIAVLERQIGEVACSK